VKNVHGMQDTMVKLYNAKIYVYQHKFIYPIKTHVLILKTPVPTMKFIHKDKINVFQSDLHALQINFMTKHKLNVFLLHLCAN